MVSLLTVLLSVTTFAPTPTNIDNGSTRPRPTVFVIKNPSVLCTFCVQLHAEVLNDLCTAKFASTRCIFLASSMPKCVCDPAGSAPHALQLVGKGFDHWSLPKNVPLAFIFSPLDIGPCAVPNPCSERERVCLITRCRPQSGNLSCRF